MAKEVKETTERYVLTEVPTGIEYRIKDNETDEVISSGDLLIKILNKVDKIEKAVA